jgi:hypothetical protein
MKPAAPIRSTDRWSIRILLLGLLTGMTITTMAAWQPPITVQDYIDRDQSSRLARLENMNISERLTVLERIATESDRTRALLYGVMATVVTSLIAQAIQIRGQRNRRG